MADLKGVNIAAPIVPYTSDDTYPTHLSNYGKGGWHEVTTIDERNAIPDARRSIGMIVYISSTKKSYIWSENGWEDYLADKLDKSEALKFLTYDEI